MKLNQVTQCALQNTANIAGLMLTTEVTVTDLPEEKKEPAMGGMGGMMQALKHCRFALKQRRPEELFP